MRRYYYWLLAALLVLAAVAALGLYRFVTQRALDADYAAVQGDWRIVVWGYRDDGIGKPSPPFDDMIFAIRGNQVASHGRGNGKPMTFRLSDGGHDPKWVDLVTEYDSDSDPGVYRLDGDILTACFANHRGEPRPTDVLLEPGSEERWLVKLERVHAGR